MDKIDSPEMLAYKISELEKDVAETRKALKEFKESIDTERTKYLVWGIGVLGAAVAGMVTFLYNLITGGHFK